MPKMTSSERRAVVALSTIMSLRMLGLFMVLPVFALYAQQLHGATPALIGLAMGIYGLCQAFFQIPFGILSDRFGRKRLIFVGLFIFAIGSLIAGEAHTIQWMIFGRALQGAGAIGSAILALIADLTCEEQRTKSMAIAGISIGFSFSLAMITGPLLLKWMTMNQLFYLAAAFGWTAIFILYLWVPKPPISRWHPDTEPELKTFIKLLKEPELAKLNGGILLLHAIFTASFIVIPISFAQFAGLPAKSQWLLYLPALLIAFSISLVCIGLAERKKQVKPYFLASIVGLAISQCILWSNPTSIPISAFGLGLFFTSFSLLEAFLPSLVSRTAPASRKGTALGLYSGAQFLGIFIGGVLGGWLYGQFNFSGVYIFSIALALLWLVLAFLMQPPQYLMLQMLRLAPTKQSHSAAIVAAFRIIPGIAEVTFIAEDGLIYLKMERGTEEHPDFIRLKEQLQLDPLR